LSIACPVLLFTVAPYMPEAHIGLPAFGRLIHTHLKHRMGGSASRALHHLGWAQNMNGKAYI
jgi:hypothetical protein